MSKINLKREDWAEIFFALESKAVAAVVANDRKHVEHLNNIIKKIGPDGARAFKRGVASKDDDWWTVALALDSEFADFERFVDSARGDMCRAVDAVRSAFIRRLEDPSIKPEEITIVGIFKGRLDNKLERFIKRRTP